MRCRNKHINLLFVLMLGMVIFSHSVIPHDHHYDNVCTTTESNHHEDEDADGHLAHCHYLNDVVINKISTSSAYKSSKHELVSTFVKIQVNLVPIGYNSVLLSHDSDLFLNFVFQEIAPTRGSPFQIV